MIPFPAMAFAHLVVAGELYSQRGLTLMAQLLDSSSSSLPGAVLSKALWAAV